jgi:nicotinamidase-related amidase
MRNLGFITGILFLLLGGSSLSQNIESSRTALLIIDIQYFYFPGGATELYEPQNAAEKAAELLIAFRQKGLPIVHVKHQFEPGGDIHSLVKPLDGEPVFVKKAVNSFVGTNLRDYLDSLKVKNVVICGMQTHMCVEAAVRAAADMGYKVTLIHDACATRTLTWDGMTIPSAQVQASTLATLKSYCKILSTSNFIEAFLKDSI